MSHSPMVGHNAGPGSNTEQTVVESEQIGEILAALEDVDCRAILEETREESLSANELSEACDLPLSTTYRKVETLTEVGLLEEQIRLSRSGKHTSEYVLSVEDVQVTLSADDGVQLRISHAPEAEEATQLLAGAD